MARRSTLMLLAPLVLIGTRGAGAAAVAANQCARLSTAVMKSIRIHENGGPETLRYEDVEVPSLNGTLKLLISVRAAGVNFVDTYFRTGLYKAELPLALGKEGAGVVLEVGSDVKDFSVGDRVAFLTGTGAYAEKVVVDASSAWKMPDGMSFEEGACVPLQGQTAHYLTCSTFPVGPEHTVLVHAGAGGTGALLIQIAKIKGARVLTTVSTAEKAAVARRAGADEVILYSSEDVAERARALTGGRGVDVVYDGVGARTYESSIKSLRQRGYLVLFGNASGAVPPIDPLALMRAGSLFVTRPTLVDYSRTPEESAERMRDVLGWMAEGRLKMLVGRTFPLGEAAAAHTFLESRGSVGKVVLLPPTGAV